MSKLALVLVLISGLMVTACSSDAAPTVTVASIPPTPAYVATSEPNATATEFDAARAYAHNRALAVDIGSRVAGTAGGQAAADYIANQFAASGLQVTRQPFEFEMWQDHGTTAQVTAPTTTKIEAQALTNSPGGHVEAELVLVPGLGNRADFARVNVRGKIALVQRGSLTFGQKAQNAEQAGAAAILIYNDKPSAYSGALRDEIRIPTLGVSGTTGQTLLGMLKDGAVRMRIDSDSGVEKGTGSNVIGTLVGTTPETIVLGGHYDSVAAGPGAGDNGTGIATLLELARVLANGAKPEHTLVFIAFDAEEEGLLGSEAYVTGLTNDQLGHIQAMLNFDMLGAGSGPLLLMGDGNVSLLARSSAQQLGVTAHNGRLPANAGSDHQSFAKRGIDTVFFMRDYDLLHTPEDTIDQVQEEYLGEAGRVAERLVERLDTLNVSTSSLTAPTQ